MTELFPHAARWRSFTAHDINVDSARLLAPLHVPKLRRLCISPATAGSTSSGPLIQYDPDAPPPVDAPPPIDLPSLTRLEIHCRTELGTSHYGGYLAHVLCGLLATPALERLVLRGPGLPSQFDDLASVLQCGRLSYPHLRALTIDGSWPWPLRLQADGTLEPLDVDEISDWPPPVIPAAFMRALPDIEEVEVVMGREPVVAFLRELEDGAVWPKLRRLVVGIRLVDPELLQRLGLAFIDGLGILFCRNCQCGVRQEEVAGHLLNSHSLIVEKARQWGKGTYQGTSRVVLQDMVKDALKAEGLQCAPQDVEVTAVLRHRKPIPPLPFLQLTTGYGCSLCEFCGPRKDRVKSHITAELEEKAKKGSASYVGTTADVLEQNILLQRVFTHGFGSSYFKVSSPLLARDAHSSDEAHLCYISCFGKEFQEKLEKEKKRKIESMMGGRYTHGGLDVSSFHRKSGWGDYFAHMPTQKRRDLLAQVGPVRSGDPKGFATVRNTSLLYITSIPSESSVHPLVLQKLNHWKSQQCTFKFLSLTASRIAYASRIAQLIIAVLRAALSGTPFPDDDKQTKTKSPPIVPDAEEEWSEEVIEQLRDDDTDLVEQYDEGDDEGDDGDDGDEGDDEEDSGFSNLEGERGDKSVSKDMMLGQRQYDAAKAYIALLESGEDSASEKSLAAFHKLLLAICTTRPLAADEDRLRTPIDHFLLGKSIQQDLTIRPAARTAPDLSVMQYAVLFCILKEGYSYRASGQNVSDVVDDYKYWFSVDTMCPFASIRYYQGIAWQEVKHAVGLPRIMFKSRNSLEFECSGKPSSVLDITDGTHQAYDDAVKILTEDLLMGMTEQQWQSTCTFDSIQDNPNNRAFGYGFLYEQGFRMDIEHVGRILTNTPKLRDMFFHAPTEPGGAYILNRERGLQWLKSDESFWERMYLLHHVPTGSPKRTHEEALIRVVNMDGRLRHVYKIHDKIAIVGDYNKTTGTKGSDKATLHFLPEAVANLVLRYYRIASAIEEYLVLHCCPKRTPNYHCYLYRSFGVRWTAARLGKTLFKMSKKYFKVGFTVSEMRHILPAIVDHFGLVGAIQRRLKGNFVHDKNSGHSTALAAQLYAKVHGMHQGLNAWYIFETLEYSEGHQGFYGFGSAIPQVVTLESLEQFLGKAEPTDVKIGNIQKSLEQRLESLTIMVQNLAAGFGSNDHHGGLTAAPARKETEDGPGPSAEKHRQSSIGVGNQLPQDAGRLHAGAEVLTPAERFPVTKRQAGGKPSGKIYLDWRWGRTKGVATFDPEPGDSDAGHKLYRCTDCSVQVSGETSAQEHLCGLSEEEQKKHNTTFRKHTSKRR
ncbi:hypothetical protein PLICRDRAFT_179317 [Plicaturopsis crispa FD-325 SS-3]|uniref:Uncharacterized protein n=1 Tax=Plicaturopsis crispa FD-325 SS-3 TaxID=944288 RepID=A0A0C9SKX4_PLICR|nr:hypothetical protein PLICRDRAFT_179317 [Plicaturopsis crispa FD-325 SS-3]